MIMNKKMKKEALSRLKKLSELMQLKEEVYKQFEEEQLYYSCASGDEIKPITENRFYEKIVRNFEELTGSLVYHVIDSTMKLNGANAQFKTLVMLYVGNNIDDWSTERPSGNSIFCYVNNCDEPLFSDFGYVTLTSQNGVLVRKG